MHRDAIQTKFRVENVKPLTSHRVGSTKSTQTADSAPAVTRRDLSSFLSGFSHLYRLDCSFRCEYKSREKSPKSVRERKI